MKNRGYEPDVIDFAYQIIALHKENQILRSELKHYKEINELNLKAINDSIEASKENIGMIMTAVVDPDSVLNKGYQKIAEEQE